jgi:hypothetical protein
VAQVAEMAQWGGNDVECARHDSRQ